MSLKTRKIDLKGINKILRERITTIKRPRENAPNIERFTLLAQENIQGAKKFEKRAKSALEKNSYRLFRQNAEKALQCYLHAVTYYGRALSTVKVSERVEPFEKLVEVSKEARLFAKDAINRAKGNSDTEAAKIFTDLAGKLDDLIVEFDAKMKYYKFLKKGGIWPLVMIRGKGGAPTGKYRAATPLDLIEATSAERRQK